MDLDSFRWIWCWLRVFIRDRFGAALDTIWRHQHGFGALMENFWRREFGKEIQFGGRGKDLAPVRRLVLLDFFFIPKNTR